MLQHHEIFFIAFVNGITKENPIKKAEAGFAILNPMNLKVSQFLEVTRVT